MTGSRLTVAAIMGLACLSTGSGNAVADAGDHWCRTTVPDFGTRTEIPVVLHPSVASYLQHADGTAWTTTELESELILVLNRMMDQAPSAMPPLSYKGIEAAGTAWNAPSPYGQYSIAIRPKLGAVGGSGQCTSSMWYSTFYPTFGVHVYIAPSTTPCSERYEHYFKNTYQGEPKTLGGILAHEIMHGLGFHHSSTCQGTLPNCLDNPGEPACCGLMVAHGLSSEHYELEYSDWDALTTVYGPWENDGDFRREGSSSLIWVTMGASAVASGPSWASAGNLGSQFLPVAISDSVTFDPKFYRWNTTTQAWIYVGGTVTVEPQFGPIATAFDGTWFFMFWVSQQTYSLVQKRLRYSWLDYSTLLGTAIPPEVDDLYMGRTGIGAALDPSTGHLVAAFRDRDHFIYFAVAEPGNLFGDRLDYSFAAENVAASTPSIACGDAILEEYNCIAVWAGAAAPGSGEHYHLLKYRHFKIVDEIGGFPPPFLEFHPNTYTTGYVMYGPPVVTYRGSADPNKAFLVAYQFRDNKMYTRTKPAAATGTMSSSTLHTGPANVQLGPPLAGAKPGSFTEVWAKYNLKD